MLKMPLRCNLSDAKPTRQVIMQAKAYTGTVRRLAGVDLNPEYQVRDTSLKSLSWQGTHQAKRNG